MTEAQDGVSKKTMQEPTAEQRVAEDLVRRAREQGLSLTRPDGLLNQLTKTVLETALNQELTENLGHEKNGQPDPQTGNVRNGTRAGADRRAPRPSRHVRAADRAQGADQAGRVQRPGSSPCTRGHDYPRHPRDPVWPQRFEQLRREYAGAMAAAAVPVLAIEHVFGGGSGGQTGLWADKVRSPACAAVGRRYVRLVGGRRDSRFAYTAMATLPLA